MPDAFPKCRWCGAEKHPGDACPIVKSYSLDRRGRITRVEFLTAADFPRPQQTQVVDPDYPRLTPIKEE